VLPLCDSLPKQFKVSIDSVIGRISMKKLALAACFLMSVSGSGLAADLAAAPVEPIAPVYVPYNWTGFYAGVQAGYQFGKVSGPYQNAARTDSGPYSFDPDSGLIGGYAGYNYQYNSIVLGIEGDGNAVVGSKTTDHDIYLGVPYVVRAEQTWSANARLRLGYAIDRFLPYVAGGVAFGNIKTDYTYPGVPFISETTSRVGWTIGAGLEYAFTDNVIARIEYRYTDLGKKSFTSLPADTYDDVKYYSNSVLAGVSYKF
jgi:outer membrane immunogenic protein